MTVSLQSLVAELAVVISDRSVYPPDVTGENIMEGRRNRRYCKALSALPNCAHGMRSRLVPLGCRQGTFAQTRPGAMGTKTRGRPDAARGDPALLGALKLRADELFGSRGCLFDSFGQPRSGCIVRGLGQPIDDFLLLRPGKSSSIREEYAVA